VILPLLLLPTAVGTSNDQKKQKIQGGSFQLAHDTPSKKKISFPVSHFIHSCNAKIPGISFGATVILSAFQHADKTL